MKSDKSLSIVIPVYNEEENVPLLYNEIKKSLDGFIERYEIIFINDGSSDKSFDELMILRGKDKSVKIINFRKNFGQSAAMSAGFDLSSGDYVVTLDADLQNDPADIPKVFEKLEEGYDIVNGWRKKRKDSLTKKIPSFLEISLFHLLPKLNFMIMDVL